MNRFIAILLLALLPLQFSWAASGLHCERETQDAGHIGHSGHTHPAEAGPQASHPSPETNAAGDPTLNGTPAADCDHCHCHGKCSFMPAVWAEPPGRLAAQPPAAATRRAGGAHAPERPERPQWLRLA